MSISIHIPIHIKDEDGWDDDEDWSDEIYND